MKNLNISRSTIFKTIIFFFLVAFTFSCQEKQEQCEDNITPEDIQAMKDNHLIDLNDAVKMYDKYDKLRIKFFKDSLKRRYGNDFKATRVVWFDIKAVRAYLKYLQENTSEAEGLAFYFAVNSSNARHGKNHQSFFIAPTISNVVDGDTIQSGYTIDKGERVFLYSKYKNYRDEAQSRSIQKGAFFSITQDEDGFLFNEGEPNPPGGSN